MACLLLLQRLDGVPAVRETSQEFKDALQAAWENVLARLSAQPWLRAIFRRHGALSLKYSYDNPHIHRASNEGRYRSLPVGPHSPDMQKLVEHPHNDIQKEFTRRWSLCSSSSTYADALQLLHTVVGEVVRVGSVARDAETLPATWRAIMAAGGDWPPKHLR